MSRKRNFLIAVSLLAVATGSNATNLVKNHSFENGTLTATYLGQPDSMRITAGPIQPIQDWTVVGGELGWIGPGNGYSLTASDGGRFLDLSGWARGAPYAGVEQSIATVVGQRYVFSFDLGHSQIYGGESTIKVIVGSELPRPFAQETVFGANVWERKSFEFVAQGATTLITLLESSPARDYIGLDNVSVEAVAAPVPEPETYAMMLAGLGLLGVVARRRKQGSNP